MKEASWSDCLYSNSSIKITPDIEKAKSLIETAKERIKRSETLFKELKKLCWKGENPHSD